MTELCHYWGILLRSYSVFVCKVILVLVLILVHGRPTNVDPAIIVVYNTNIK